MKTSLPLLGIEIYPDQMQIVNCILVITFVKIFDLLIYPCLGTATGISFHADIFKTCV